MANLLTAIGLMSGTSMDGIDVAMIKTDGENIIEHGPVATFEFDAGMREVLTNAMADATAITLREDRSGNLKSAENTITNFHIKAVEVFLQQNQLTDSDIDVIGFHGQTVLHRPGKKLTVQLGDGQHLANTLSIPVVFDLRAADVAAGGQGAPLVPVFHRALAANWPHKPVAIVNIGGISNVTWISQDGDILAFDCGPGNALLDDWMKQHTGKNYDEDGAVSRSGDLDNELLRQLMSNPYFNKSVPKSLDRGDFTLDKIAGFSLEVGARTLTEFTAKSIANSAAWFSQQPKEWIICGGGRHNKFLMQRIAANVQGIVTPAEVHRLNGDALEAAAFAYLAVRNLKGLAITFPSTTGVEKALQGGVLVTP